VKNWPGRRNRLPHPLCKPLHSKEGGADGFVCRAAEINFSHLLSSTLSNFQSGFADVAQGKCACAK